MGEQQVSDELNRSNRSAFMQELLADLSAIERMLNAGTFESGITRVGAEQEFFLVDKNHRPAAIATAILNTLNDPHFTTELAKFNLEANMSPLVFSGDVLSRMESELLNFVRRIEEVSESFAAQPVLTGILPTLAKSDLTLANMTDAPRYHQLNAMLTSLRKHDFHVHIKGIDEITIQHDNMMLEACNTSFQLHLQVSPQEFADLYNIAQLISSPVLAAAANSPLLFGKKLWAETRVALFQHSVDERSVVQQERYRSPRVTFGEEWVNGSVLEIFREDIARFRILLTRQVEEDPLRELDEGRIPLLNALRIHNGTVWRWNRPCYGVTNGRPHLRIENRVLPAGPTVVDEVANAAFFFGLMIGLKEEHGLVSQRLQFDHAKSNFVAAARLGLEAQMHWIDGRVHPVTRLILDDLLPLAQKGLARKKIRSIDSEKYLQIIRDRVESGQTGSVWIKKSFAATEPTSTLDGRLRSVTRKLLELQNSGNPVHEWPVDAIKAIPNYNTDYEFVGQFMSTSLFTVSPDDIVDYVASLMHWQRIRHVPVEDEEGRLVGLVSQRDLLVLLVQGSSLNRAELVPVSRIMKTNVLTIPPETTTLEAIDLMKRHQIGCLPVVRNEKLVGIITTYDLLNIAAQVLEKRLREV